MVCLLDEDDDNDYFLFIKLFTKYHHYICITIEALVVVAMWLGDILLRDQHHRDGFFNRCRRVKDDADL